MKEYEVEPLRREGKPSFINSLKKAAKFPFKFAGALVEKVAAPVVMAPYQIATDAVVSNKLKKPIEYEHDVEFAGVNVPVSHKLDASKSSIDRGFSLNKGFTNDYNVVLDHEIRLGKPKPSGTGLHPLNK